MNKRAALDLAGDVVDTLGISLLRIQALSRAIAVAEDGLDRESLVTLASMADDESHKARVELAAWFDGLAKEGN